MDLELGLGSSDGDKSSIADLVEQVSPLLLMSGRRSRRSLSRTTNSRTGRFLKEHQDNSHFNLEQFYARQDEGGNNIGQEGAGPLSLEPGNTGFEIFKVS